MLTEAGLESQKRKAPTGAFPSLNAGGSFTYAAKRLASAPKVGSSGASFRSSCTTNWW